jgi:tripartite-type tricarboxylate transporter receptor subunit TctC
MTWKLGLRSVVATSLSICAIASGAPTAAADDFYKGKTITIVVSTAAGGVYDLAARALSHQMPNHIPGEPTMIVQNMPGGGHMLATNYIYNVAPKDGTTIGSVNQRVPIHQVIDGRGVKYDVAKFIWVGSLGSPNAVMAVWHTAGVNSIADAKTREVIAGATGEGSSAYQYPAMMNNVLGTRFKIVMGYKSPPEVILAMERGEVQALGNGVMTFRARYPEWVDQGKIRFIVQFGLKRDPEIPGVPLLTELAETEEQRQVLELVTSPLNIGRPYFLPPGVPADGVAALRAAFEAAVNEESFIAEMAKQDVETVFIRYDEVSRIVEQLVNAPADVVAKAKEAMAR